MNITAEQIAELLARAESHNARASVAGSATLIWDLSEAVKLLVAEREWQPIETAPHDLVEGADAPIEISCFHRGELLWACAAYWGSACYGDIHCASRTGWFMTNFPPTAKGGDKPKPSGDWVMPNCAETMPTHWRRFPPAPHNREHK